MASAHPTRHAAKPLVATCPRHEPWTRRRNAFQSEPAGAPRLRTHSPSHPVCTHTVSDTTEQYITRDERSLTPGPLASPSESQTQAPSVKVTHHAPPCQAQSSAESFFFRHADGCETAAPGSPHAASPASHGRGRGRVIPQMRGVRNQTSLPMTGRSPTRGRA